MVNKYFHKNKGKHHIPFVMAKEVNRDSYSEVFHQDYGIILFNISGVKSMY